MQNNTDSNFWGMFIVIFLLLIMCSNKLTKATTNEK